MPRKRKSNTSGPTLIAKRVQNFRKRTKEVNEERFVYKINYNYCEKVAVGALVNECVWCHAKTFRDESSHLCCGHGQVELESLPALPRYIGELLEDPHFLSNVRNYNNAFCMTSLGCEEEWNPMTFKISGQIYHRIGSLLPANVQNSRFLQIYFVGDRKEESLTRQKNTKGDLRLDILEKVQEIMHTENKYVQLLKCAYEKAEQLHGDVKIMISDSRIPMVHKGRTNAPAEDEVAVFIAGVNVAEYRKRDILIQCK